MNTKGNIMSITQSTGRLARLLALQLEHPEIADIPFVFDPNRISFTTHDTVGTDDLLAALTPINYSREYGSSSSIADKVVITAEETPIGPVTVWFYLHHSTKAVAA